MRCSALLLCFLAAPGAAADLKPFTIAWNDASEGITNLQSWQPREAGVDGWVGVSPEGHYTLNGERVRFLGVNVTAASAFPSYERAAGHAARLARFGFNSVRFHHLEAPWDKRNVLIDYAKGSSRELSPERLDRLHHFIARLAERGIYTNLNLLVSREFQPADGLGDEIARLGWKDQHVLGFFNDTALELHKEYATQLLAAPNPHRGGAPLAADPALAFVEIMNENGLLQKWHEGVLDALPGVYRDQLRAKWNAWLKDRYPGTAAMLAAWGAVDEPLGGNKVANGDFAAGTSRWVIERHSGAAATVAVNNDFNGSPALRVEVTAPGSANWHVQINQPGMPIEAGAVYTLRFWARAANSTPLAAVVMRAHSDYASLGPAINVTLTSEWREYSLTYQNATTESNARVNFNGFGNRTATVWLADVRFQPGGRIGGIPEGASLEAGTVPPLARQGSNATLDQRRDWVRFTLALESAYWNAMYRHIKETLGYKGIVWGTIISNSPPNAQSGCDAFDSHAYWQHPTFAPGRDWDPELWTVQNVSMVNDRAGGTLGTLARQRVAGRPHNLSEYQHPAPNTYGTEGPLLAAAYAALQDWDAIWFFEYNTGTAEYTTGFFDHGGHPGKMANNLLAAAIFRRGDVAPALNQHVLAFPPETETDLAATRGGAWNIADGRLLGVPAVLALVNRLALSIGPEPAGATAPPADPGGDVVESDTGQLRWDTSRRGEGVVTINAPRTRAVVGFTSGRAFDLGSVVIAPGETRQNWSSIGITLLEGDSFDAEAGARAVIVATGEHANTGMVWKDASRTSVGTRWGSAPALIEVVPASITLPAAASRVKAWALDERGQRAAELTVAGDESGAVIRLGENGDTLWYEVEIGPR